MLTSDPVEFFSLRSGTTGSQKFIPITSTSRARTNNDNTRGNPSRSW
ncbi:GH3 family domain-containing protein [Clostridium amylolyticum]